MKLLRLIPLLVISSIISCTDPEVEIVPQSNINEFVSALTYTQPLIYKDVPLSESLKINFTMGNLKRTLTYQKKDSLILPGGREIVQGELKPTWQYIEERLGFSIIDVANQEQASSEMIVTAAENGYSDAVIYGGTSIAGKLMNNGAQGAFVNLKKYLKYMPNLTKYLNRNPNIAKSITAYDGGIYYLPYIAEINNYARVVNVRDSWIVKLLDSPTYLLDETESLSAQYKGFWNIKPENIIALQNSAGTDGLLTRDRALSVLLKYIKSNYPDLKNPSDLYLGSGATYNMDELVALWRVIKLSPNTLSQITTGNVVSDAKIFPYFARQSSYRDEVLRLLTFLDGQRCHASDATSVGILYEDHNNKIVYSYADPEFLKKVEFLKQWYAEGLIYSEYSDLDNKTNFRSNLFFSDDKGDQYEFGFMTLDWIGSTTGGSDKIKGMLPPMTTISKANINEFIHYVENTRSIKPDGWSISASASEGERNRALQLFDYMFSEEGTKIQNYSIPETWVPGRSFSGPDGKKYPEFNQWLLTSAQTLQNGDINGFLREYLGSQLTIGYQKQMGVELQGTSENGMEAWELYTNSNVLTMTYDSTVTFLKLMPPIISLTANDISELNKSSIDGTITAQIHDYITGSDQSIMNSGYLLKNYENAGIENYQKINQIAYDRMMEPK